MKETVTIQRSESYDVVVCGGGPRRREHRAH